MAIGSLNQEHEKKNLLRSIYRWISTKIITFTTIWEKSIWKYDDNFWNGKEYQRNSTQIKEWLIKISMRIYFCTVYTMMGRILCCYTNFHNYIWSFLFSFTFHFIHIWCSLHVASFPSETWVSSDELGLLPTYPKELPFVSDSWINKQ